MPVQEGYARCIPRRRAIAIALSAMALFAFFSWSAIERAYKVPLDDYHSHIRADAAGYYIYLPGLFHYGFKANTIDSADLRIAGLGFGLDRDRDRIVTKYTCGTALLQLPFYLVADTIVGIGRTNGLTRTHHNAINLAGIFYWLAGSVLLMLCFFRWRPAAPLLALLVFACASFGTNLFFYAFRMPGYSHVYSFFLVSLSLYAIMRGTWTRRWQLVFVVSNALIVLMRPIDLLAVCTLYGLVSVFHGRNGLRAGLMAKQVAACIVIAIPQLLYWHHVHDHWIVWSYTGEGFTNWASPHLGKVIAAPMNGLLPNAPVFALLPFALVVLWLRDRGMAILIAVCILLALYACASWHAWHFGLGYGMRPMVQYVPFLALSLWALLAFTHERSPGLFHGAVPLLIIICFINYRAMLQSDIGYFTEDPWDWCPYGRNLLRAFFGDVGC